MSDQIQLEDIKTFAAGLSPWAHLATVGADGKPDPSIEPPGKQWRPLRADKWKRHVQYGWRLALSEVAPKRARPAAPRERAHNRL